MVGLVLSAAHGGTAAGADADGSRPRESAQHWQPPGPAHGGRRQQILILTGRVLDGRGPVRPSPVRVPVARLIKMRPLGEVVFIPRGDTDCAASLVVLAVIQDFTSSKFPQVPSQHVALQEGSFGG